ncbi:phage shock protein B [Shewanella benthica]|nr:phage shock protein B [Shewanella benthica]
MEKELIIMVVMIVFIASVTLTEGLKQYLRLRKVSRSDINQDELELLRKQNRHLEARVQTLERIVTDSSYDLKQEINSL